MPPIVVRVDIPALSELVDYLIGRQQPEIDAIAGSVEELTEALRQSTWSLNGAIQTQTKEK